MSRRRRCASITTGESRKRKSSSSDSSTRRSPRCSRAGRPNASLSATACLSIRRSTTDSGMETMIEKLIELSIMSGGLLPLMAVLLLVTLAVVIERSYFFHKVLKSGLAMEHDLQMVEYQNVAKLEQLANHYEGSLQ